MRIFAAIGLFLFTFARLYSAEEDDFELLLGKETSHWHHMQQQEEDYSALKSFHSLYLKNKKLQFENTKQASIPQVIHFIWLGPRPFPAQSVENMRSWIAKNPGWKVKFWTDRERDLPCEGIEKMLVQDFKFLKLQKCYEESQNWGEKSDLLRYEILFQEGGLYTDHDIACFKSFDNLQQGYDLFIGLEPPHEAFAERNLTINNGLIGVKPHHPLIARVIERVEQNWDALGRQYRGKDDYSKIEVVMRRTYIPFTHAAEDGLEKENNRDIVFPAAYFFAKAGIPSIYAKHFYDTLWDETRHRKTEFEKIAEKSFSRLEQKSRNILYFLLGLTLLNCTIFALLFSSGKKISPGKL